jgi:DNA polymerase III delta prime subunit
LKEPNRKFLVCISLQKTISITLFTGLYVVRRETEAWLRQAERDMRKAINDLQTQD